MNNKFKKLVTIVYLAFIANTLAFAVNSEFKNTLTNIDLTKTSEDSYTVNLYTSKKFTSPVKVIKKSDLSYYILLPETKNTTPRVSAQSSDIRTVSTAMFPYAGVDINNGYTKIDINTTRPIKFSVQTKSANQKSVNSSTIATNLSKETKVQKKNPVFTPKENTIKPATKANVEPSKEIVQTTVPETKEVKKQTTVPALVKKSAVLDNSKTVSKENVSLKTQNSVVEKKTNNKSIQNRLNLTKITQREAKKEVKQEPKRNVAKEAGAQIVKRTKLLESKLAKITSKQHSSKEDSKAIEAPKAMAAAKVEPDEPIVSENLLEEENQTFENEPQEDNIEAPETLETINNETVNDETMESDDNAVSKRVDFKAAFANFINGTKVTFANIKNNCENGYTTLADKLYEYGLTVLDLLFMLFAGIFSFVAVLLILSKKPSQPKLKNKSELTEKEPSLVAKKENEEGSNKDENNGKYFVFERNIKQTELITPATEKPKNFELVSYDPESGIRTKVEEDKNEDEDLDIIQKILKEDSFVDIKSTENVEVENSNSTAVEGESVIVKDEIEEVQTVEEPIKQSEAITSPIGQEHVQKEEINFVTDEPQLLATHNISPEQGFMFVSYDNNVSLMGFIFDDVYVLHNYKVSSLPSYDLQFRLVDKDDSSCVYIVKTQGAKLLVKVTKTSMNTEILL